MNANITTITNAGKFLMAVHVRGLLTQGKSYEARAMTDANALFLKNLRERAKAPLKIVPIGTRRFFGSDEW